MKRLLPPLVLLATLGLACLILPATVVVDNTEDAGVRAHLPDTAGDWQGEEVLFCSNPQCAQAAVAGATNRECTACGSALESMSPDEKSLLPADTVLERKTYRNGQNQQITVTLVFSGRHRSSIHRPELCLVRQGSEIVSGHLHDVALAGRAPLRIKVLNFLHRGADNRPSGAYFAYWFVGPGHETPSHYARMFWMGWERVVHSRSSRWAYLALSGRRSLAHDLHLPELDRFLEDLYPQIVATP